MPTLSDLITSLSGVGDTPVWNGSAFVAQSGELTDHGFLAMSGSPNVAGTLLFVSQSEIAVKVPLLSSISATSATLSVSTAGGTLTAGQNLINLYRQDGVLLGSTADQSGVWTGTGVFQAAFAGGPYALVGGPGRYCWVSVLSNGTTPVTLRAINGIAALANVSGASGAALTGAAMKAGRIGAAVTVPASFTPANLSITSAGRFWVGLS